MSFVSQMISLFFGLLLLTILARLWFTRSSEDYAFLTVDENTGDLAIVDGGGDLVVDDSGTLKSTGNFIVNGELTTTGTVNGVTITSGSLESPGNIQSASITTGNITAYGDITAANKKITSGSLTTTGEITANAYINTTQSVRSDGLEARSYLKIGNTTINEDDLKRLKGVLPIKLINKKSGVNVLRRKDGHSDVGVWDTGYSQLEEWNINHV